jgi:hypothetical protein
MSDICTKIKLYAKSKGVNSVDFLTDVVVEQPAGEEAKIKTWNLSIDEPTTDHLNSFETAANEEVALQKAAEQAAIDKKASGKQKLKDLGLDDAEINALIGA